MCGGARAGARGGSALGGQVQGALLSGLVQKQQTLSNRGKDGTSNRYDEPHTSPALRSTTPKHNTTTGRAKSRGHMHCECVCEWEHVLSVTPNTQIPAAQIITGTMSITSNRRRSPTSKGSYFTEKCLDQSKPARSKRMTRCTSGKCK